MLNIRLEIGRIDYHQCVEALLSSPLVADGVERLGETNSFLKGAAKLALQMGAHMSPENLEKQGVALLNAKKIKEKLKTALADALRQVGLDVEIEDVVAETANVIELPETPHADEGLIPDAFEDELMDALVKQLRKIHGS